MGIKRTLPTSNRPFRLIQAFKLKRPMMLLSSLLFQVLSVHFILIAPPAVCDLKHADSYSSHLQPTSLFHSGVENNFHYRWHVVVPCAAFCPQNLMRCLSVPALFKKKKWRNLFPLRSVSGQDNHPKHLCVVYTVAFMHFSTLSSVYFKKSSHRLLLKTADYAKPKSTLSSSEHLLPLLLLSMSTSHIALRSRQVKERRGNMNIKWCLNAIPILQESK